MDSVVRYPTSATEPAATQLNLESYELFLKSTNDLRKGELYDADDEEGGCSKATRGCEIEVTEKDVFEMKPEEMDAYMDWYEKTWCGSSDDEKMKEKSKTKCKSPQSSMAPLLVPFPYFGSPNLADGDNSVCRYPQPLPYGSHHARVCLH